MYKLTTSTPHMTVGHGNERAERKSSHYFLTQSSSVHGKGLWLSAPGTLFSAQDDTPPEGGYRHVTLGGAVNGRWRLDVEQSSLASVLPCEHYTADFLDLPRLMAQFEAITGIKLPCVWINVCGDGWYSASASGPMEKAHISPYDLIDGQIYSQGASRHPWGYEAVQTKAGMQLRSLHAHAISHELFDPSLVFSPDEWLAVAQTNRPADDFGSSSYRPTESNVVRFRLLPPGGALPDAPYMWAERAPAEVLSIAKYSDGKLTLIAPMDIVEGQPKLPEAICNPDEVVLSKREKRVAVAQIERDARHYMAEQQMGLTVELSCRGNPDHGDNPFQTLPHTPGDFRMEVSCLAQASAVCRAYLDAFSLGSGNWTGGRIEDRVGRVVGHVAYNGRVFTADKARPQLLLAQPGYWPQCRLSFEDFFVAWRDRSMINHEEAPASLPSL